MKYILIEELAVIVRDHPTEPFAPFAPAYVSPEEITRYRKNAAKSVFDAILKNSTPSDTSHGLSWCGVRSPEDHLNLIQFKRTTNVDHT